MQELSQTATFFVRQQDCKNTTSGNKPKEAQAAIGPTTSKVNPPRTSHQGNLGPHQVLAD